MPDHRPSVVGTWKLKSFWREVTETKVRYQSFGPNPTGYMNYSADGRMMAMIFNGSRSVPKGPVATDAEAVALYRSMLSYTGRYVVEGDKVVHHLDGSWNEIWTGTALTRFFKIEGRTLTITTAPALSASDGKMGVSTAVWEKVD